MKTLIGLSRARHNTYVVQVKIVFKIVFSKIKYTTKDIEKGLNP